MEPFLKSPVEQQQKTEQKTEKLQNDLAIITEELKNLDQNMSRSPMGSEHIEEEAVSNSDRSSREKSASSEENIESALGGQGASVEKKASYHCNYCNKDITGRIRIKCAMCPDFDLCIECFSVGAEVQPHKNNHSYRVMDGLSFPLICPDWSADEEILLLEGLDLFGLDNWAEVAEHVGTKNTEQCSSHYRSEYLNSPSFPLPDFTRATANGNNEDKKGPKGKEVLPSGLLNDTRNEDIQRGGPSGHSLSTQTDNSPVEEGSSLLKLSGFNPKRREFDQEYDNDAERLVAELEFNDADTEDERELKLRVLRIYSKRLDERERRKDFILERNLLYTNDFEKDFSPEEKAICRNYDPFMRFSSKEDHEELLKTVIKEHRTRKRIQELEEARAAGCRTTAEAKRYFESKRKREAEAEESAHRENESGQNYATGKDSTSTDRVHGHVPADELLSEAEKLLCHEIKITAHRYLKMQEMISVKIFRGEVTSNADTHCMFNMEPAKIDRVYSMLVRKGIAPPP